MTNEEKILAKLDQLAQEIQEVKQAARPYVDLKETLEPIINAAVSATIAKLDELGGNVSAESLGDLVTTTLVSSGNLAEALKALNAAMDLKHTLEPVGKQAYDMAVASLDQVSHRFDLSDVGKLLRQSLLNMGNLAEGLKMLSAVMDLKETMGPIPKIVYDEAVAKLEDFRQQGGFEGLEKLAHLGQALAIGMAKVDLEHAKPISGVFGMMSALKRPEVQYGLGVSMELAAALGSLKKH